MTEINSLCLMGSASGGDLYFPVSSSKTLMGSPCPQVCLYHDRQEGSKDHGAAMLSREATTEVMSQCCMELASRTDTIPFALAAPGKDTAAWASMERRSRRQ